MSTHAALYDLSSAQQGLWFAQNVDPTNPIFNTAHYTELRHALNVPLFIEAVDTVLAQADVLTLRLEDQAGHTQQRFDAPTPRVERITHLRSKEAVLQHLRSDQQTPVDLYQDPCARFILYELHPEHFIFYSRIHHLAADGYAMNLLEARCIQHYLARCRGLTPPQALGAIEATLAEDQAYLHSPKHNKDRAFWLEKLSTYDEVLSLSPTTALTDHRFLYAQQHVNPAFSTALLEFAARHDCSWADVLTLLTAAYIARHTGQYDSVFGVPYMGRLGQRSALTIATVMNVAPLPLCIQEHLPVHEFIQQGAKALMLTRRHGRYRSEQLRRDLGLLHGMRRLHGPLINILPFDTPYAGTGLEASSHVVCAGPVEDINFSFRSDTQAHGMRLEIEANPTLYQLDQIQAHIPRLLHFITHALRAERLADVPTVTAAEHELVVKGFNQTAHPVPATTLSHLCAQTAQQYATLPAISDDTQHLSYTDYQSRVESLAVQLHAAGVRRGDCVAVALERRVDMVLALHAILRAGAAYLPLDGTQPTARLRRVVQQAQPRLILSDAHFPAIHTLSVPHYELNQLPEPLLQPAELAYPSPGDRAYLLFTSGSTGEPKGVVISHQAIVNRLMWMRDFYAITPLTRFIQKTPYTFDVSVWELFLPFISGAQLYVAPPESHKDPQWLAQLIQTQQIEVIHFVPSMLDAFLADATSQGLTIPLVFCSGEALSASLRDRFYTRIQGELHNLYGPTEAAVDVSYWHAARNDHSHPVPIGFPVWNTALYVLDTQLRPLPVGVAGDLYLGGVQLAEGYLNRPDLTEASFLANPFASGRMYKTGDKARWRADGAVEYLGRADFQVKLRGLRIELGEIEQVLTLHPQVQQAVALVREDQPGQQQLVAYVLSPNPHLATEPLFAQCRDNLPDYMVPNAISVLSEFPLNSSGKLDRKALPAPQRSHAMGTLPHTALERQVAMLFSQTLQLSTPVYSEDNFFSLGGHSLLAARMVAHLRDQGYELNLGAIFAYPTVSQLAQYLENQSAHVAGPSAGFERLLLLHQGRAHTPALFCIHPAGGLSWCYGALARSDLDQRSVYGLQSSTFHNETLEPTTVEAMAYAYADAIQSAQPQGPYHLLGWSVGGILAHAIAVELQHRQAEVGVVCLVDAYPSAAWRAQPVPEANAIYKALLHIAGYDPNELPDVELERQSVIDFLRQQNHPLGALADTQLNGVFNAVAINNQAVRDHNEAVFNGPLLYIHAGLDHKETNLSPHMWQPWAHTLTVHSFPFLHAHLTSPEATALWAPVLRAALTAVEQQPVITVDL